MELGSITNRVAESDLIVFNLEDFWDGKEVVSFDIAPYLFKGLVLREKDFRVAIRDLDTEPFANRHVAISCSTKAIIPTWAHMIIAVRLRSIAASIGFGTPEDIVRDRLTARLTLHDWDKYKGRNVIVKGCPSAVIPTASYVEAVLALQGVAAKIMYGEACSSVPVWKQPASANKSRQAVKVALPKKS